ncbi:MAG: hypothetical protein ACI89X_001681 [Planctomycetota bacterium]|jgi:hypothetical protein
MESILLIFAIYLAVGLLFGIFFAMKGVKLLDPVAVGSPISFRLLVIPGATALWPVLLIKLLRLNTSSSNTAKGDSGATA